MTRIAAVAAAALSFAACTLPQVVPEALTSEFKSTGEVRMRDRTCAFDSVRVRNPWMNITKRTDGSWGGTFAEAGIDVDADAQTIKGANFFLTKKDSTADKLVITGQFQGRIYRFELDQQTALIRTPNSSATLPGRTVQQNGIAYGPRGELVLLGEAGSETPPWPQIGFALIGAMN